MYHVHNKHIFYCRIRLLHRSQVQHQLDLAHVWVLMLLIMHVRVLQIGCQSHLICHQLAALMLISQYQKLVQCFPLHLNPILNHY